MHINEYKKDIASIKKEAVGNCFMEKPRNQ